MVDILKIGPHRIGRGATQQLSLALTINLIESVVIVAHIWNGRLSITIFSFRAWPDALVSRNKWPTYGVREGIFHPPVAEAATQATPRMNKKRRRKKARETDGLGLGTLSIISTQLGRSRRRPTAERLPADRLSSATSRKINIECHSTVLEHCAC